MNRTELVLDLFKPDENGISRWVSKDSDVIAISESVKNYLIENREVSTSTKVHVVHYGFIRKKSDKSCSQVSHDLNKSKPFLRIGTISRLAKQKNLPLLLDLAKILRDEEVPFSLSILGTGPEELNLKGSISGMRLGDTVNLLGRRDDVYPFLQELDIFILTSNYEGFGLVLLEAMDCQIPIVASNISAIPEVLGREHPGLFEPGNVESLKEKVDLIRKNNVEKTRCLKIQSQRLTEFSVTKYRTTHDQVYRQHVRKSL